MYTQTLTGQALIDLAGTESPLEVRDTPGNAVIGVAIALCILSTIAVSLRLFVRLHIQRDIRAWGWDDTFSILSLVSCSGAPPSPHPHFLLFDLGKLQLVLSRKSKHLSDRQPTSRNVLWQSYLRNMAWEHAIHDSTKASQPKLPYMQETGRCSTQLRACWSKQALP